MRRLILRSILAGVALGSAFAAAAEAQPPTKLARVVLLNDFVIGPVPSMHEAFRQGMRELGWVEGRNVVIEERYVERPDQRDGVSAEIERLKIDVVVASPSAAFAISPSGSAPIRTKPIVFAGVSDPVALKLVASLARPGGNMTGLSYLGLDLNVKRLQLLKEAFPKVVRIGVLVPKDHPLRERIVRDVDTAAAELGVKLVLAEIAAGGRAEPSTAIAAAFETMARERIEAVLGVQGAAFFRERKRIAELCLQHRLPGIFELAPYVEDGGLMAYGPSVTDLYRHAARYTDRILRGAKPSDLPVEQPTKVELIVNLKTARALGVSLPQAVLLRTDRVIE